MNKYIQSFCNYYIKSDLEVDGVIGNKTKEAIIKTIASLKNEVTNTISSKTNKNMVWLKDNFICIRTNKIFTNKFDDWFILVKNDTQLIVIPSSSKAGSDQAIIYAYRWIMGKQGIAILKPDQYIETWTKYNNGWSGLPYYMQTGEVTIYRDNNADYYLDYNKAQEQTGLFGINIHSWIGFLYNFVGNLSQGCLVSDQKNFLLFMIELDQILTNNKLSLTLLQK